MTLDIAKYLENLIKKEAAVSHFTVNVHTGKTSDLRSEAAEKIKEQNGDSFLQDADYILFFTRQEGFNDDDLKKLFDLTNRALGKDANGMSKSDFKRLTDTMESAPDRDLDDTKEAKTETITIALFLKVTIK